MRTALLNFPITANPTFPGQENSCMALGMMIHLSMWNFTSAPLSGNIIAYWISVLRHASDEVFTLNDVVGLNVVIGGLCEDDNTWLEEMSPWTPAPQSTCNLISAHPLRIRNNIRRSCGFTYIDFRALLDCT